MTQRGIVPKCVRFLIFVPILSGLRVFYEYSCVERKDELRKENTYMKKLITIILALIMTLFTTPQKGADQPPVTAVETPQTAITTQVEQVPEDIEITADTAFVSEASEAETTVETQETTVTESETEPTENKVFTEEKTPAEKEPVTEDCIEIAEEKVNVDPEEETVECIDKGDQSLAEYKLQIGGQPNPFENDTSTEIDDRPVEDYVGEGEDRPGEGIHF